MAKLCLNGCSQAMEETVDPLEHAKMSTPYAEMVSLQATLGLRLYMEPGGEYVDDLACSWALGCPSLLTLPSSHKSSSQLSKC
uniref:Uncharacterized protein n=1 Tax=Ditylenchus dipsaci TaxID=166011 RepID=A0A915CM65_9BILA